MNVEVDTSDSQMRNTTCNMQKLIILQSCCGSPDVCGSSLSCFLLQNKQPAFLLKQVDFKSLSGSIYLFIYLFYSGLILLLLERNEI